MGTAMLDWLRRPPGALPVVSVGGAELPLVIRRMPQARRMTMRLAPDGREVRVTMPQWGREAEALAFARTREAWLARQLARLPKAEPLAPGALLPFRGAPHRIEHHAAWPRRVVVAEGVIRLGGADAGLEARLRRWLQGEARALFAADLADYCPRAGVDVPALALSNARSRWGSCSVKGMVRLNWRLAMAPDFVRRSVVAHEVTHLLHFDHSPRFHAELARLFEGNVHAANRWLKAEGRGLYHLLG